MSIKMNNLSLFKNGLAALLLLTIALAGCYNEDDEEWFPKSLTTRECVTARVLGVYDDKIILDVIDDSADHLRPLGSDRLIVSPASLRDCQEGDVVDLKIHRLEYPDRSQYGYITTFYGIVSRCK